MANQIYITGQAIHDLASDPVWDMPEEYYFLTPDELNLVNNEAEDASVTFEEAYEALLEEGKVSARPLNDWE